MVLPQAIPDGFRSVLSRFKTGITKEEYDEFQFTELEDVHDAIHQIQEKHGSEGKMQNLARLQRFLEGMEQYGKVVEVFLNSSQIIPFVWVISALILQLLGRNLLLIDVGPGQISPIGNHLPSSYKPMSYELHV